MAGQRGDLQRSLNRTSVGLKRGPEDAGDRAGRGLNRTSVGLKLKTVSREQIEAEGLNRTSVGLKLGFPSHHPRRTRAASIEPAWD